MARSNPQRRLGRLRVAAGRTRKDPEADVLETIAAMSDSDRAIAEPLHALILDADPELTPRLWYGQPAYARAGKVIVFFRGADHDGERYFTLGFTQHANLDSGGLWPTAYALTELGSTERKRITELVESTIG